MTEASFTGFIKTIVYIMVFYYLFKFLLRIFGPILLKKAVDNLQQKMYNDFNKQNQQQNYTQAKTHKNVKPTEKKKVGEYIDYEEVE